MPCEGLESQGKEFAPDIGIINWTPVKGYKEKHHVSRAAREIDGVGSGVLNHAAHSDTDPNPDFL